ncbi:CLUMA_CG004050, isoform A [Clunio marinus]|uniref:CLUMA_CG004050, isoform A n=1 Tax=Clunio marinus TaxID=568069 RepID=A0A1J1HV42_9DIPT|nr:CLUMA_CG004050, isoform A [Clunio marinus]
MTMPGRNVCAVYRDLRVTAKNYLKFIHSQEKEMNSLCSSEEHRYRKKRLQVYIDRILFKAHYTGKSPYRHIVDLWLTMSQISSKKYKENAEQLRLESD